MNGHNIFVKGKKYSQREVDCIPDGVELNLPDGYMINVDRDDNGDEAVHVKGRFQYREV